MFRQHAAGVWFDLAKGDCAAQARPFKAKAKAANARKKIQKAKAGAAHKLTDPMCHNRQLGQR